MYYIVNDVETGGRHRWYHDVVSCGLVVLNQDYSIIDKFYEECCPWNVKSFDHETVVVHGLSLDHLLRQQSSYQMSVNVLKFLNPYRDKLQIVYRPFIYHALNRFDFLFMENLFLKNGLEFSFRKIFHRQHSYSTIKVARSLGYEANDLKAWAGRMGEYLDHHNALADTVLTAKIFRHFMIKGVPIEAGFEIKKSEIEQEEQEEKPKPRKSKSKDEDGDIWNSSLLNFLPEQHADQEQ